MQKVIEMSERSARTYGTRQDKQRDRILTPDEVKEAEELRMKRTTDIAGNLFHAPSVPKMVAVILIISFCTGFFVFFDFADPGSNLSLENIYSNGVIYGIVMMALPAIVTGLIITRVITVLGGIFYEPRAMLLALSSLIIICIILLFAKFFTIFANMDFLMALYFAYGWVFAFQLSILMALSNRSYLRSTPPALIQPLFGFISIYLFNDMVITNYAFSNYSHLLPVIFLLIFFLMTAVWIYIVTWPLRKEFNANGLDLARQGFQHFTEGEGKGMELENFFESFGRTSEAEAGILAIRRRDDSGIGTASKPGKPRYKGILIVPDLHKGPFGYLAGSNMPQKISNELKTESENIIFAHGAATHDRNPVSTAETLRVARAIKSSLSDLKPEQFSNGGGRFIRVRNGEGVNIGMQYIGDAALGIYTSAPEPTDDISYRIGMKAREVIKESEQKAGKKKVGENIEDSPLFIDGHNSMSPGKGYVHFNSPKKELIYNSVRKAVDKALETKVDYGLKLGIANKLGFDVQKDGLGPLGIQVLTVLTSPDKKMAYIIFDGNNLQLGLRKKIIEHVKAGGLVDSVEVLTTDNHIVNMTIGGYSPVGEKLDHQKLMKILDKLVKQSVDDLENVEVASLRVIIKNFKIFGHGNTFRLSTTINNTMSIMGKSFPVCYGIATILCIASWIILG